ncbi:MAG: hypothetical protein M3N53_00490 [Actinomycetota bacterium]|nr:hypothetical protein [Actinomycetota bacterium]
MRRQKALGVVLAALVSVSGTTASAAPAVGDRDDSPGGLDIAEVQGKRYRNPGGSRWLSHKVTTYEAFEASDLGYREGRRYGRISLSLDVDRDAIADHFIIVSYAGGRLRAELLDDESKTRRVRLTRPNDHSVKVSFRRRLIDWRRGYYWSASSSYAGRTGGCTFDSGGCYDYAPDPGAWVWLGRGQHPRD